jgi:hypothetical protein
MASRRAVVVFPTGEQVGVGDALAAQRVLERPDDRGLAHHGVEGERPPAPGEHLVAHEVTLIGDGARG